MTGLLLLAKPIVAFALYRASKSTGRKPRCRACVREWNAGNQTSHVRGLPRSPAAIVAQLTSPDMRANRIDEAAWQAILAASEVQP